MFVPRLNSQSCIGGAVLKKRPRAICLFLHHDSRISYPPIANRYRHDIIPLRAASAIRGGIRTNRLRDRAHYCSTFFLIIHVYLYILQEINIKLLIKIND